MALRSSLFGEPPPGVPRQKWFHFIDTFTKLDEQLEDLIKATKGNSLLIALNLAASNPGLLQSLSPELQAAINLTLPAGAPISIVVPPAPGVTVDVAVPITIPNAVKILASPLHFFAAVVTSATSELKLGVPAPLDTWIILPSTDTRIELDKTISPGTPGTPIQPANSALSMDVRINSEIHHRAVATAGTLRVWAGYGN